MMNDMKKIKERKERETSIVNAIIARRKFLDSIYVACPYSFSLVKGDECSKKCKNCWMKISFDRTKIKSNHVENEFILDNSEIDDTLIPSYVFNINKLEVSNDK